MENNQMTIFIICAAVIFGIVSFLAYYPSFGAKMSKEDIQLFRQLPNFNRKSFINQTPTPMSMGMADVLSLLRDYVKGNPNRKPIAPIPMQHVNFGSIQRHKQTRVTWFGHSALMLEMEGKTLLLDPMLGPTPSPIPFMSNQRYSKDVPIDLNQLPIIDAVIFSHDHYDHLDYRSIQKLKDKVKRFFVPLGLGSHLVRWGVAQENITEHNWWEESELDGLQLICTPARHFSGRSLFDRNATLWCSWVIIGQQDRVYFSGDSGYATHFKEIGERYGPFDLTLMECGQYDERWANIHMMPEETVQAHLDVKGKVLFPIHWGAFTLALHDWNDPIERVIKATKEKNVEIVVPKIGEPVQIPSAQYPNALWWK